MKKFILPSIFAFGLLFSCNNDDDSSIDNANIVGTWSFVKYQTQYSKDNKIEDQYLADACNSKDSYTFAKDNKYSATGYDTDANNVCKIDWTEEGTYTITGNKIRIDYKQGDFGEGEISKLTKNELILKSDYGEDLDKDGKNEIDILVLKR
ncbi:lipocalin-like domain-containing protein [Empedobacter sedimenti]|uniref:lipocalin family protein n=1 Tax=Empedobacter sedimenti TaxID=3042610 RepID=UPI0024A75D9E|nr:lipocalin family protein [Empedobacter sedimenti]